MDLINIKKLMKLFKNSDLNELTYADDEFKLMLRQGGANLERLAASTENKPTAEEKSTDKKTKEVSSTFISIKSPMVGTFYKASSPTSKPFIEIGKTVNKGDTLCIIEAMKIMNEIEAEYPLIIRKVMVEDSTRVEYGTSLFLVERV